MPLLYPLPFFFLALLVAWPDHVTAAASSYTCFDDYSWHVMSLNVSNNDNNNFHREIAYQQHMEGCATAAGPQRVHQLCTVPEENRIFKNRNQPGSMRNLTTLGFVKRKTPPELLQHLLMFWSHNQHRATIEFAETSSVNHNTWAVPTSFTNLQDPQNFGGGFQLTRTLSNLVHPEVEEWVGEELSPVAVYGIRTYHNEATVSPHVDRVPLAAGVIISVSQDVDEPWPLEIYNHNGVAHNITLNVGEMILYESQSCIHGRPFPLQGRHFAAVYMHFAPTIADDALLPGSMWEKWVHENVLGQIRHSDTGTMRYTAGLDRTSMTKPLSTETSWQPIHEAVRQGLLKVVKMLLEEQRVDINSECYLPDPTTPLTIAKSQNREYHLLNGWFDESEEEPPDDELSKYLMERGGIEMPGALSSDDPIVDRYLRRDEEDLEL